MRGRDDIQMAQSGAGDSSDARKSSPSRLAVPRLASVFQPVYGLATQWPAGYEALAREVGPDGRLQLPAAFGPGADERDRAAADLQSHAAHLASAGTILPSDGWLFLNIHASSFRRTGYVGHLAQMADDAGLRPEQIVLELLETGDDPIGLLADNAEQYRAAGFLLALDDYGAGYSNLGRFMYLRPDIVKLDRTLISRWAQDRALLTRCVRTLHEAGTLVVAEGIETREELRWAVEANVDCAQGILLGRAEPVINFDPAVPQMIDATFNLHRAARRLGDESGSATISDVTAELLYAAARHREGLALADSCAGLLSMPGCVGCFELDCDGRQIGEIEWGPGASLQSKNRTPPYGSRQTRRDNCDYFLDAWGNPGHVVRTVPFRSVTGAKPALTFTIAIQTPGGTTVIGLDHSQRLPTIAAEALPPGYGDTGSR